MELQTERTILRHWQENENDSPLHLTQDILFYCITKQEWIENNNEKNE
jgi:hypothetical protein